MTRDDLDRLLALRDKLTCAQIDAGACRTSADYRARDAAEGAFEEAYHAAVEGIERDAKTLATLARCARAASVALAPVASIAH